MARPARVAHALPDLAAPGWRWPALVAVVAALVLIRLSMLVGQDLNARGLPIVLPYPPLLSYWHPHTGVGTPLTVLCLLLGLLLQRRAPRLRWGHLLLAGWLLALAWMVSLVMIDGLAKGWTTVLTNPNEYLHDLPRISRPARVPADVHPLHRLRRRRDRGQRLDDARGGAPAARDPALLGAGPGRARRRVLGRAAVHPRVLRRGGRAARRAARARRPRRRAPDGAVRGAAAGRGVDGGVGRRAVRRGGGRRPGPGLPRREPRARAPAARLEPGRRRPAGRGDLPQLRAGALRPGGARGRRRHRPRRRPARRAAALAGQHGRRGAGRGGALRARLQLVRGARPAPRPLLPADRVRPPVLLLRLGEPRRLAGRPGRRCSRTGWSARSRCSSARDGSAGRRTSWWRCSARPAPRRRWSPTCRRCPRPRPSGSGWPSAPPPTWPWPWSAAARRPPLALVLVAGWAVTVNSLLDTGW